MNCKTYREDLIGLIRGQLTSQETVRIRKHLTECPDCLSYYNFLASTLSVIEEEKKIQPDPFLSARLLAKLESSYSPVPVATGRLRLATLMTYSLFILAGIAGGFGLGKLISPARNSGDPAALEIRMVVDDLRQEPIEAFFLEL